jgi:autotransporter family porin
MSRQTPRICFAILVALILIFLSAGASPVQTAQARGFSSSPAGSLAQSALLIDKPYKSYLPMVARPGLNVARFATLPPGATLPNEAECAGSVKSKAENKRMNATYNQTKGNQTLAADYFGWGDPIMATNYVPRVTGNFTGTTDEILQWAACKWGIDEDIVRAQAARESWWQMTAKGDWSTDAAVCPPGHGLGMDGVPGQCPESWGIMQVRYIYRTSAWPSSANSTAFNVDLAYAEWRVCYEGLVWWLTTEKGDTWGCVGRWFSGGWHDSGANWYIGEVQGYMNQRIWEQPDFQEP